MSIRKVCAANTFSVALTTTGQVCDLHVHVYTCTCTVFRRVTKLTVSIDITTL